MPTSEAAAFRLSARRIRRGPIAIQCDARMMMVMVIDGIGITDHIDNAGQKPMAAGSKFDPTSKSSNIR